MYKTITVLSDTLMGTSQAARSIVLDPHSSHIFFNLLALKKNPLQVYPLHFQN